MTHRPSRRACHIVILTLPLPILIVTHLLDQHAHAELRYVRQVADAVHGNIPLTQLEWDVLRTGAVRRLNRVSQHGQHIRRIFPSGAFSRLSHALGATHLAGRMVEAVGRASGHPLSARELQMIRLGMLLHDLGHYPLSHVTERALAACYGKTKRMKRNGLTQIDNAYLNHEALGREVMRYDKELADVIRGAGYDPEEIASLFQGKHASPHTRLLSGGLDADRIDYLLRTEHHTGIPHAVDVNYILDQIRLDNRGRVAFSPKAIATVDRALLSRYHDYQRVPYNDDLAGIEYMLAEVIGELVRVGKLDASAPNLRKMIRSGEWKYFNDDYILRKIGKNRQRMTSPRLLRMAEAVLTETPPHLVFELKRVAPRRGSGADINAVADRLRQQAAATALELGLDPDSVFVWSDRLPITKELPASVEPPDPKTADTDPSIRIKSDLLDPDQGGSQRLVDSPASLLSILGGHRLEIARVYALPDVKRGELGRLGARLGKAIANSGGDFRGFNARLGSTSYAARPIVDSEQIVGRD